ncbi:MAG: HAD-IA family hydrolase [Alphaproteobacteria bacterium]
MQLKALLFDVDGTLADTEDAHRIAFNAAFVDFGFDWHWDRDLYTRLLAVTGGQARIRYFLEDAGLQMLDDAVIADMHKRKTTHYVEALQEGRVPLRPGVENLIHEARTEGLTLAIATTTTPVNVQTLLENTLGPESLDWFKAIGAGDCVENLKPSPDVYLWVLDRLGLEPDVCLALEDSANGLKSASAAGLQTIVTHCPYTAHHDFDGALAVFDEFDGNVDVGVLRGLLEAKA